MDHQSTLAAYRRRCEQVKQRRQEKRAAHDRAVEKRRAPDKARAAIRQADIASVGLGHAIALYLGEIKASHTPTSLYPDAWPERPDYPVADSPPRQIAPIDLVITLAQAHEWRTVLARDLEESGDPGAPARERARARVFDQYRVEMRRIAAATPPPVTRAISTTPRCPTSRKHRRGRLIRPQLSRQRRKRKRAAQSTKRRSRARRKKRRRKIHPSRGAPRRICASRQSRKSGSRRPRLYQPSVRRASTASGTSARRAIFGIKRARSTRTCAPS